MTSNSTTSSSSATASPIRPDLRPLRDALITDFTQPQPGSYRLVYEVRGKQASVAYTLSDDGSAEFTFVDIKGPGLKKYHITVFALSSEIEVVPQQATRANLRKAMQNILLGESTLDMLYER